MCEQPAEEESLPDDLASTSAPPTAPGDGPTASDQGSESSMPPEGWFLV
jgi:hypothetical protein